MAVRLSKIAREFNVGLSTIVEFLHSKGIKISSDPNAKLTDEDYALVAKECFGDATIKDLADFFQLHFNVDLGDYYGVYKEIKERVVKNRASFLSDLAEALLKRMDEDENS